MSDEKKAVILVSGGLDSTTVLALAREQGFECFTLSFDYGQRHRAELFAAERIAAAYGDVEHKIVTLNLDSIGGSALTDDAIAVPEQESEGIPVTYVPARNTVFLSIALGWAEVLGAAISLLASMPSTIPDTPTAAPRLLTPSRSLRMWQPRPASGGDHYRIHTPLMELGKDDIVKLGARLGVDYSLTVSCYQGHRRGARLWPLRCL